MGKTDMWAVRGVPEETRKLFAIAAKMKGCTVGEFASAVMEKAAKSVIDGKPVSDETEEKIEHLQSQIQEVQQAIKHLQNTPKL